MFKKAVTFCAMAIGLTLSITTTVTVVLRVLLLASVAVKVTRLFPKSAPVKAVLLKVKLEMPQLSLEPLFTIAVVKVALPLAFKYRLTVLFTARVGLVVSETVMVAFTVLKLPLASVPVKVTELAPKLLQSKVVLDNTKLVIAQLSVEPLFTKAAVILALPFASKKMVLFCAVTIGLMVSTTNTLKFTVLVLFAASVTVKPTELLPRLVQVNELVLIVLVATLQLSELALSAIVAVIVALPEALR